MRIQRRLKRRVALRVWKALGSPGEFKDFWRKAYGGTDQPRISYRTNGTAITTSDRVGLLGKIKQRLFSRRIR